MGQLQRVFEYEGQTVRAVVIDGNPYVVAVDVARSLGYKNPHAKGRETFRLLLKEAIA